MCRLKSGIILKDRIYIGEKESHTEMLKELGIKDETDSPKFVRAELYPENGDVFSDVSTWIFNIDQDFKPDWFVAEYEEERFRTSVEHWHKEHVFIDVENLNLECKDSGCYYLKNCNDSTVRAYDNSTVRAYGNSTVKAYGNSTVEAYNNSTVEAYNNSTVKAYDNSTVRAYDNSTVKAYDNSTVTIPVWSSNSNKNIILSCNSTLKDCKTKTIYQSGDWRLELVVSKDE